MSQTSPKVILAIAGFDPSSGAGITADLKTIAAHGLYGVSCITALTVQTTQGVFRSEVLQPDIVRETLDSLVADSPPVAVKIGMLGSGSVAAEVAKFLKANSLPNIVLDPVLRSSSGAGLLDGQGLRILTQELFALADVVTPNLDEAAVLTGDAVTDEEGMERASRELAKFGAKNIVVKGGHLAKPADLLAAGTANEQRFSWFRNQKVETRNTHGTGCAYSTSIACNLAIGQSLDEAVLHARNYVAAALREAYDIGKGTGPINHFHSSRQAGTT